MTVICSAKVPLDEPHVVQRVHDAGEEPVDEHGVDAAVARGLGALDHHEHDGHAVHGVQDGGEPALVPGRAGTAAARTAVMAMGKKTRYAPTTLRRRFLNCHSASRAMAAAHMPPIDSAFTSDPDRRLADGERAHDARAEPERAHAQRAAPVVARHAAVHAGMLARNVLEHGLVAVDRAAFQRNGQAEQRQEHERDEKRRHRLGNEVEREVKQRGPRGSQMSSRLPLSASWLANSRCHSM